MDTDRGAFREFKFETKAEMMAGRNTCADMLLFLQDQLGAMKEESNMFSCEEMIDGEWEELEDE